MISIDRKSLSAAVRAKRGKRSLRDIEKEIGISFTTLNRVEREYGCTIETYVRLCNWLLVPLDQFVQSS